MGGFKMRIPPLFERTHVPGDAGRGRRRGEDAWAMRRGCGRSGGGGHGGFGGGCRRGAGGQRKGTTPTGGAHLSASRGEMEGRLGPAHKEEGARGGGVDWADGPRRGKGGKRKRKGGKDFPWDLKIACAQF
uniref:EBNA-1 nuclear protein-like n=1 Tax=Oryza sativa subsp. japonica TaxID=39947 RepID=Q6K5Z8_ORYSJ|nr:EBNA-1 nuclear protein-like [Oryza sativa Japonica Group]BAD19708.1 EBNA-1 nuclear protein-like [Oryza sativa Japonica Group]